MLRLDNISKSYKNNKVLKEISIKIDRPGLVTILGNSGSGKTTILKIIGGLLKSDSGSVNVFNKKLDSYNEKEFDNYRSNYISYIYQDYYLLENISVYNNVLLPLNIIKLSKNEKKKLVMEKLKLLHIDNLANKKVKELSGGEKQRVAIARAIVKNPQIILADEPTGALDSTNSIIVMDILKELSKTKLVIVVSHNEYLSRKYSDRMIYIKDGMIIKDDIINTTNIDYKLNNIIKPRLHFKEAFRLSLNNLLSKKIRTFLIALGSSLSIISLMLVISISQNTLKEIDNLEEEVLVNSPIVIPKLIEKDTISSMHSSDISVKEDSIHSNILDSNFISNINSLEKYTNSIYYDRLVDIHIMDNSYNYIDNSVFNFIPSDKIINNNYKLVSGRLPSSYNEIVLLLDTNKQVSSTISSLFNDNLDINNILNTKFKLILNNEYYIKDNDMYKMNYNYQEIYKNANTYLKVVGIIMSKENNSLTDTSYLLYSSSLIDYIIKNNKLSDITKEQLNTNKSLLTNLELDKEDKDILLSRLGLGNYINGIYIYPTDGDSKDIIINTLDNYDDIIYEDASKYVIDTVMNVINILSAILIFFSILSIGVSIIMMVVITYISTLEREGEILLLRMLGVRRKDVKKVFTSENFIIGIISSIIGIIIVLIISIPINIVIENLTGMENIISMNYKLVMTSVMSSLLITKIGGIIPIWVFSKKID